jgi:hypothetical protein
MVCIVDFQDELPNPEDAKTRRVWLKGNPHAALGHLTNAIVVVLVLVVVLDYSSRTSTRTTTNFIGTQ